MKSLSLIILLFLIIGNINIYADISKRIDSLSKVFLDNSTLEKAGIYHVDSLDFRILFKGEFIYLLNYLDKVIARCKKGKIDKVYRASGQGPGEFIYPRSIFLYDQETLGVFDTGKYRVIFFDLDLNFKNEIKVNSSIRKLTKFGEKTIAFGDFDKFFFSLLNNNFEKIETFCVIPAKLPFKRIFPQMLYGGYFIDEWYVFSTSWVFFKRDCKADIIELESKKVKLSLRWKHPSPPTQKSIDAKKNFYGSYYMGKHGNFYVVQNALTKKLPGDRIMDTIIFSHNGKILFRNKFPYFIIPTNRTDGIIYFVDEDENISLLDLKEFMDG